MVSSSTIMSWRRSQIMRMRASSTSEKRNSASALGDRLGAIQPSSTPADPPVRVGVQQTHPAVADLGNNHEARALLDRHSHWSEEGGVIGRVEDG